MKKISHMDFKAPIHPQKLFWMLGETFKISNKKGIISEITFEKI